MMAHSVVSQMPVPKNGQKVGSLVIRSPFAGSVDPMVTCNASKNSKRLRPKVPVLRICKEALKRCPGAHYGKQSAPKHQLPSP